jgi:hypothetical protein
MTKAKKDLEQPPEDSAVPNDSQLLKTIIPIAPKDASENYTNTINHNHV